MRKNFQERFTQDEQPHYVYSPRELTRWVRGICEVITAMDGVRVEDLVRLWAHEALRLFHDRLVHDQERAWTEELVDSIASKHFTGSCDLGVALQRPMLYSCWLSTVCGIVDFDFFERNPVSRSFGLLYWFRFLPAHKSRKYIKFFEIPIFNIFH